MWNPPLSCYIPTTPIALHTSNPHDQRLLFNIYIYIFFTIISFPSVDSQNVSTEVCATLFRRYLFLFYLCTLLEFWTIIGTVRIQLIHGTYQLRVLDYYRLWAPSLTFNMKSCFETILTRTKT